MQAKQKLDAQAASVEAGPFVFELPLQVQEEDLDGLNHVNNVVYLRWVQDVATAHWRAAATEEALAEYAWVALRHEIDYLRPALLGDALVARTHVGEANGARFERFVEIVRVADDRVLARTRSIWAAIDAKTGKPRRVDPALRHCFFTPPGP